MANAIYPKWKSGLMAGHPSANIGAASVVRVALVDTGVYTYNASDWLFSNVSSAVVGTPANLANKTIGVVSNATYDADNVVYTSVSGASVEAIVIYIDTGVAATSNLVAYIDTGVTGLPVTPNGGNINLNWDVNGIFTL